MDSGYIKVFRKMRYSALYKNSELLHLWIELLLRVNHSDAKMTVNGSFVTIKKGTGMFSRAKLSESTGISESKIQRFLKTLESEQLIEQQTNSRHRIISITNWHLYQNSEQQVEQPVNSERTASEQRVNTNNKNKNEENDKNEKNEYKKNKSKKVEKPDDVDSELWDDFITYRKGKRAPVTDRIIKSLQTESEKAGVTISKAIEITMERAWNTFRADWHHGKKKSLRELANDREADDLSF